MAGHQTSDASPFGGCSEEDTTPPGSISATPVYLALVSLRGDHWRVLCPLALPSSRCSFDDCQDVPEKNSRVV